MPLLKVNGTRLYADIRGAEDAPPLLFVHGGPGQSCFDFMRVQGDRLARTLRVIGVDMRGLLRSDPWDGEVTAELLVEDLEAVREELGYASWAVLGHSAGGWLATLYAYTRPESVSAVVFDSPGWDADVANRHRLALVADIMEETGDTEGAAAARELMVLPRRMTYDDGAWELFARVGDRYDAIVFHNAEALADFEEGRAASGFTEEDFERGAAAHVAALRPRMFESWLDRLADIRPPSLLLRGRYDPVVPPVAVNAYREAVPDPKVVTFDNSSHMPHLEEPDAYAEAVTSFLAGRTL